MSQTLPPPQATCWWLPRSHTQTKHTIKHTQCPLKPESEPTLSQLAASSHMLVMITGDAPLTACHAAGQVHIVQRPVLVLQHK